MYDLKKKIGKVFTNKFVGTGPSSFEKRIYRATVSHRLRNTALDHTLWRMFVYVHNPDNNINSCQLVPEEADYCVVLLKQYGLVLVNLYNLEF